MERLQPRTLYPLIYFTQEVMYAVQAWRKRYQTYIHSWKKKKKKTVEERQKLPYMTFFEDGDRWPFSARYHTERIFTKLVITLCIPEGRSQRPAHTDDYERTTLNIDPQRVAARALASEKGNFSSLGSLNRRNYTLQLSGINVRAGRRYINKRAAAASSFPLSRRIDTRPGHYFFHGSDAD